MDWEQLRKQIDESFNEEELRTLCFALGEDYDSLGGRGKSANVRELVDLIRRNGRYSDIYSELSDIRPQLEWPDTIDKTTGIKFGSGPAPFPETQAEKRVRHDLLNKVKSNWIQGYFERSVHNDVPLKLGYTQHSNTSFHTRSIPLQKESEEEKILPSNKTILETYYENQRKLLILGEPGAGKTITLLEIAKDLIALAEADETQSIPVVLNLSTWAEDRQPLQVWLEERLFHEYQISKKTSREWIATAFQLTLLLDGLDEVKKEYRNNCVQAINNFQAEYSGDLIICCRTYHYEILETKLIVSSSIMLNPLTFEQIDDYLTGKGKKLSGLHQAIQHDDTLKIMAQTPLFLSMMSTTYQNQPVEHQPTGISSSKLQKTLFSNYVQNMLSGEGWSPTKIKLAISHLSWLAVNMTYRGQTTFSINNLQKSWFLKQKEQQVYSLIIWFFYFLLVTFFSMIILGGLFGSFQYWVFICLGSIYFGLHISIFGYHLFTPSRHLIKTEQKENFPLISSQSLLKGLGVFLGVGISLGILSVLPTNDTNIPLLGGMLGLSCGIYLSRKEIKNQIKYKTHIRHSTYLIEIVLICLFGISISPIVLSLKNTSEDPIVIVLLSISISLIFFLGLNAVYIFIYIFIPIFEHIGHLNSKIHTYILEKTLSYYGYFNWDSGKFLDDMVTASMLYKSGETYQFSHMLLQEYFSTGAYRNAKPQLSTFDIEVIREQLIALREEGNYDIALKKANQMIELTPRSTFFKERSMIHREMGAYENSIADYTKAIELDPTQADHYYNRALTYDFMGAYKDAILDYSRAIEIKPTQDIYFFDRGITHQLMGSYKDAISDFNRAIDLDSRWAKYFFHRGITYQLISAYEDAITDYTKAIKINSKQDQYFYFRGICYQLLHSYEKALSDFKDAIELNEAIPEYFLARALVHSIMESHQLAIADYNKVIELDATQDEYFYIRGIIFQEIGDYQNSIRDITQAIELNQTKAEYFIIRGFFYLEMKKYENALSDFNNAIELNPTESKYYENRSVAYYMLERIEESIADRERSEILKIE